MPNTKVAPKPASEVIAVRPQTFRLPKPGVSDPHYAAEARGWLRLIRIRAPGRERGITVVPYQAVEALVRAQMKAQKGGGI